ncbi:hypothetical protein G7072_13915 [Nocardioides sp. HDW12B]|nr:hypothetical protein G7072_13915 [Nocardioides sp. HDW12B]
MPGRVDYYFGELPGHPVGSTYRGRKEAMWAGLHDNWVPGISGNGDVGANCIALNKGYVDDEDHGDWILYTGAGANDSSTGRQIADQDINHRHNAALVYSEQNGLPVRVLRGPKGERPYAPSVGYRYDGLYKVIGHWAEPGRDGYRIWRFRLSRLSPDEAIAWTPGEQRSAGTEMAQRSSSTGSDATGQTTGAPTGNQEPGRASGIVQRIVRSTAVSQHVKELHGHRCQMCGLKLDLLVGQYSEGAHIRALGAPHNGPDTIENVLCLCPNDHVLLDKGAIYISDDLTIFRHDGAPLGNLTTRPDHRISIQNIGYHRLHHGF